MKTIGSHPGAILFRLSLMGILIGILIVVFFSYVAKLEENLEQAAILRTKGLINSSLVAVFATYAAKARLDELNDLNGANPFEYLREYQVLPPTYRGEIDHGLNDELAPGWYYLTQLRQVTYKPRYLDGPFRFALVLAYDDVNQSGRYETGLDAFQGLHFSEIPAPNDN